MADNEVRYLLSQHPVFWNFMKKSLHSDANINVNSRAMKGRDTFLARSNENPYSDDKGNPMRAELGKKVGRTSVPFIFVDGNYLGGYDGGINDDAPGIVDLAFKGTLRPKLIDAGAMKE